MAGKVGVSFQMRSISVTDLLPVRSFLPRAIFGQSRLQQDPYRKLFGLTCKLLNRTVIFIKFHENKDPLKRLV